MKTREKHADPKTEKIPPSSDEIIQLIMDEIERLFNDNPDVKPSQIGRIGIGWPGPPNYQNRTVNATYLDFENYPLQERLEERFEAKYGRKIEVLIVMDSNAGLAGERLSPHGGLYGESNGAVVDLATGISFTVSSGGKILDSIVYTPKPGTKDYGAMKIVTGLGV